VLARPKWRSLLLWQAAEALLWVPRLLWYLGSDNRGVEIEWFFLVVALRDVAVLVLMGLVVRDILRPDGDVVRTTWPGIDDPAGGPLDGADDRLVPRRRLLIRSPDRQGSWLTVDAEPGPPQVSQDGVRPAQP
jgi:uncharacterized membrane protein